MFRTVRRPRRAFTLVEILIVVVILGILASIVVAQFAGVTGEAQSVGTYDQLQKIRKALAIYYVRAGNVYPNISAGSGAAAWGELMSGPEVYLREAPVNMWVGGANGGVVTIGNAADTTYHQNYGWIWDPTTGSIWAAGFDAEDQPLPRP